MSGFRIQEGVACSRRFLGFAGILQDPSASKHGGPYAQGPPGGKIGHGPEELALARQGGTIGILSVFSTGP